jgi:hypothetical protein
MSRYDELSRMTERELENIIRNKGWDTGTGDLVEEWFNSFRPGKTDMVAFILEQEND